MAAFLPRSVVLVALPDGHERDKRRTEQVRCCQIAAVQRIAADVAEDASLWVRSRRINELALLFRAHHHQTIQDRKLTTHHDPPTRRNSILYLVADVPSDAIDGRIAYAGDKGDGGTLWRHKPDCVKSEKLLETSQCGIDRCSS